MQGEGTGGALVPTEDDVLAWARSFQDLAKGLGPISDAYTLRWLAWRMTPKAGPWPRDWKGDLRRRFLADSEDGRIVPVKNASSKRLDELKARLEKGGLSPEERAALREEIRKLENP